MRNKAFNNKGFTLVELLVVITIIGILAIGGTAFYTQYQADSIFSKDNTGKVTALSSEMQILFSKNHTLNNGTVQLDFKTIENTLTPDTLTFAQVADIYRRNISSVPSTALSNVLVCGENATPANIDNGLTTNSFNNAYLDLILFVDQSTPVDDCLGTNVIGSDVRITGTVVRYKNNQINESEDYVTYMSADGGLRSSMSSDDTAGNFQFYGVSNVIDRTLNNVPTNTMLGAY